MLKIQEKLHLVLCFVSFSCSGKKHKPALVNIALCYAILPVSYVWELILWSAVQRDWKHCFFGPQRISSCFCSIPWLPRCFWEGAQNPFNQRDADTLCSTHEGLGDVAFQIPIIAFHAQVARHNTSFLRSQESSNTCTTLQASVWGYRGAWGMSHKACRQPSWHLGAGWQRALSEQRCSPAGSVLTWRSHVWCHQVVQFVCCRPCRGTCSLWEL